MFSTLKQITLIKKILQDLYDAIFNLFSSWNYIQSHWTTCQAIIHWQ